MTRAGISLLAALLVATVSVPAAAAAPCSDVTIVGVAGSGQSGGAGPQVETVIRRIDEILTGAGRSVTTIALDYPAIDLARTLGLALFDGRYRESVAAGEASLHSMLDAGRRSCPESVVVLVGYSQGAQVIRGAVARLTAATPIAAIALLADPTSAVADPVTRLGAARDGDGTLGAVPMAAAFAARTIDACAGGDAFCGGGRLRLGAHSGGYGPPLSDRVAMRAAVLASAAVAVRSGYPAPGSRWPGALIR